MVPQSFKDQDRRDSEPKSGSKKAQRFQDQLGEYQLPSYAMGSGTAGKDAEEKAAKPKKKGGLFSNIFRRKSKAKGVDQQTGSITESLETKLPEKVESLAELELYWNAKLEDWDPEKTKIEIVNCSLKNKIYSNDCDHVAFEFMLPKCCMKPQFKNKPMVMVTFAEKAIQLCKAALMGDEEAFDKIAEAKDGVEAGMLGRQVKGFDETLWTTNVLSIAVEVTYQKFSKIEHLKTSLLETGDSILVVAIFLDNLWGVSFDEYDDDEEGAVASMLEGKQKNLLGYALMEARHKILNPKIITLTKFPKDGKTSEPTTSEY